MTLLLIPAVWMLARIASARNGERIASVTTDAKFFVVLAFIGFVCPTVNASCLPRDGDDIYNRCASGPTCGFVGLVVLICRPRLTSFDGPTLVIIDGSNDLVRDMSCRPQLTSLSHKEAQKAQSRNTKGRPKLDLPFAKSLFLIDAASPPDVRLGYALPGLSSILHARLCVFLQKVADVDR